MNKVILIGNLGADPDLKYTQNKTAVCNFSMATTERYKDKNGDNQTKTEWHNCVTFNRTAGVAGEFLKKGSRVAIEGKIETQQWQDKDGNTRYTTKIIVTNLEMLGEGGQSGRRNSKPRATRLQANPQSVSAHYNTATDDIPF